MTHRPTDPGLRNRTGIQASPQDWRDTADSAMAGTPDGVVDMSELARVRIQASRSVEPLGTMPAPMSIKGVAQTLVRSLQGEHLSVFLDLMGERIAYERLAIRLYDALLCKHAAAELRETEPRVQDLALIRNQELDHLALLVATLERLGGDPTAVTPSADATAVASRGLMQVLSDPRTTFTQAMRAMLQAELADHCGWETLLAVAESMGMDDIVLAFRRAVAQEQEHVLNLKSWLIRTLKGQAA